MPCLLVGVRFHDGRYHGGPEWPPSPARLFQALVSGAARGTTVAASAVASLTWLESLDPPIITVPAIRQGQSIKTFVPNNDLDAVDNDPARVGEIRTPKSVRPRHFDAALPLLYAWSFDQSADADRQASTVSEIAENLYQFGRGVDMAWAQAEVVIEEDADARRRGHGGITWRPSKGAGETILPCPHHGSLASLEQRFAATRARFKTIGKGKRQSQLFTQAPKPDFIQVAYGSLATLHLYDVKSTDSDGFASQRLARVVAVAEKIRDQSAARLKRALPDRIAMIDRVFIGRNAGEADKAQRLQITPLPSVGHPQANRSIRRVLVAVPPNCPLPKADIAWAFSGLALDADPATGEVPSGSAILAATEDRSMLDHYGIVPARPSRLWHTVTPAALPDRAARRRIDPRQVREQPKGGAERLREEDAAVQAVRQALRHAGIDAPVQKIRVQREPFEAKGARAEAFASDTRFAKERLWHAEISFSEPVAGPLLIGDGRYLGLGLMKPMRRTDGVFAFAVSDGLGAEAAPDHLVRALRRAVMARVQDLLGARTVLPSFFTGHDADGCAARPGGHRHLAFAFDAPRRRLLVLTPHILEHRNVKRDEVDWILNLEQALMGFRELRAGPAGKLTIAPALLDLAGDPLFGPSSLWESLTPYRAMRHAKAKDARAALAADLLIACRQSELPDPEIEVLETFGRAGLGLFGRARLRFRVAVAGALLLGRDRHFGGGLFAPVP